MTLWFSVLARQLISSKKHFVRRRRWIRTRVRDSDNPIVVNTTMMLDEDDEHWEYAVDFGRQFRYLNHGMLNQTADQCRPFKRKRDFVRRRRWHRERELIRPDHDAAVTDAYLNDA